MQTYVNVLFVNVPNSKYDSECFFVFYMCVFSLRLS